MKTNKTKTKRNNTSKSIPNKSAEDLYLEEQERVWKEKNWYSHMKFK